MFLEKSSINTCRSWPVVRLVAVWVPPWQWIQELLPGVSVLLSLQAVAGLLADARSLADIAREEASNFRSNYGYDIPLKVRDHCSSQGFWLWFLMWELNFIPYFCKWEFPVFDFSFFHVASCRQSGHVCACLHPVQCCQAFWVQVSLADKPYL